MYRRYLTTHLVARSFQQPRMSVISPSSNTTPKNPAFGVHNHGTTLTCLPCGQIPEVKPRNRPMMDLIQPTKPPFLSHRTDITSASESSANTTILEDQLIQVTASYVSFVNARQWADAEDLQKHYHPAYRSECRFSTHLNTFLESIKVMRERAETFPNFKVNVVEASANVDRSRVRALVFFHTNWTDAPPGLVTQVVHVVDWRFVDGQWLAFRSDILRGVDEVV